MIVESFLMAWCYEHDAIKQKQKLWLVYGLMEQTTGPVTAVSVGVVQDTAWVHLQVAF